MLGDRRLGCAGIAGSRQDMEALQRGFRGELDFRIPSFSAFNRYSIQLAALSSRLNQTREIAATTAEKLVAKASDHLTLSQPRQSSPWSSSGNAGEGGLNALRSATQAQRRVHATRQKVDREFQRKRPPRRSPRPNPEDGCRDQGWNTWGIRMSQSNRPGCSFSQGRSPDGL